MAKRETKPKAETEKAAPKVPVKKEVFDKAACAQMFKTGKTDEQIAKHFGVKHNDAVRMRISGEVLAENGPLHNRL